MYNHSVTVLHPYHLQVSLLACGPGMLKELFTAESKAQVYAALHDLLSSYPNVSASLRRSEILFYLCQAEFVRYDDGCHLRETLVGAKLHLVQHSLRALKSS